MIEVILNGKKIKTDENQTILELAEKNNIDIPTLCKDPRLKPITSCFLCVVEVKGARTLLPACATYITEGMDITTNSQRVLESRKTALELILSDHLGDCVAPCKLACPAECDVQGYVGLIANKKYKEAIKLIKETIPLPAAIGRVCPRFCEEKCRRQFVDEPVAIDYLKRFAADMDLASESPYKPNLKPKTGKKVAIIGGGPAGLSSAYYLIQEGVDIEIFEAQDSPGGMIYYGVPDYRLPKKITTKEIKTILDLGVKVNNNMRLGDNFTIDELRKNNFNAVVLAMGAWKSRKMGLADEDIEGVYDGIKYLENLNKGNKIDISGRVAIIGGGNTAFDCARTAIRLGAKEVVVVYRRTRDEMPANEIEIIEAEEEGIKFQFLTAPEKIIIKNNRLAGLECIQMELGDPDESGRRSPVPLKGSNFTMNFDYVITAIGQSPDYSMLGNYREPLLKDKKWIIYNSDTGQTNVDFIFTAGDFATGAATVVEALAGGKKAADSIIKYLNGEKLEGKNEFISTREEFPDNYFNKWNIEKREKPDVLKPEYRKNNFDEIENVFTEKQALKESKRCLECGCMDVYQCSLKKYSEEYGADEDVYKGAYNVINNDDSHPYIFREPEKCILCGRCIELCNEKINIGVYGYINRGFDTVVSPQFNIPLNNTNCTACGTCISGCPVGAIVPKTLNNKKIPLKGAKHESVCLHCSIGCLTTIECISNTIYEVHERDDYLCKKGKFKYPNDLPHAFNTDIYKSFLDMKDANIYPSPSLSAEEYEALKEFSNHNDCQLFNYYSQSTLWQAFADINSLPSMDFFTKPLVEKNSLIIIAGNMEAKHPVAINKLNEIINKYEERKIILINKTLSIRLKNLKASLLDLNKIDELQLSDYANIILLINPIDFDEIYGPNSSIKLYNYLAKSNNLHTTLFSEAKNLYSFYDANIIPKNNKSNNIFIKTIPDSKKAPFIHLDVQCSENTLGLGYPIQTEGTFLNSKNQYYKNIPIINNGHIALNEILNLHKNYNKKINLKNYKNVEQEKPFDKEYQNIIKFPDDSIIKIFE